MNLNFFTNCQIKHHIFSFLMAVVQVSVAFLLILTLFADYSSFFANTKMFKDLDTSRYLIVENSMERLQEAEKELDKWDERFYEMLDKNSKEHPELNDSENYDMTYEQMKKEVAKLDINPYLAEYINENELRETPYFSDICAIYETNLSAAYKGEFAAVSGITEKFAQKLNMKMRSGNWLTSSDSKAKTIDAVVFKNTLFKVGDTIPLKNFDHGYNDTAYEIRIIGICDYSCGIPTFGTNSTSFDTMNLSELTDNMGVENYILALTDDFTEIHKEIDLDFFPIDTGLILELQEDLTEQQIAEAENYLTQKRYSYASMPVIYGNTLDVERNNASTMLIPMIIASVFSILAITAVSVFQMENSRRKFKIYYYCGMKKGQERNIHILYLGKIMLSGIVLSGISYIIIGLAGYLKRISDLCESGYDFNLAKSWTSINEYIHISAVSVAMIVVLSVVISLVSTFICSLTTKYYEKG